MQMLALKEIHMTYGKGDGVVHALRGVDMEVERESFWLSPERAAVENRRF